MWDLEEWYYWFLECYYILFKSVKVTRYHIFLKDGTFMVRQKPIDDSDWLDKKAEDLNEYYEEHKE